MLTVRGLVPCRVLGVFYLSTFYTRFDLAVRIGLFYGQYAIAGAFSGCIGKDMDSVKNLDQSLTHLEHTASSTSKRAVSRTGNTSSSLKVVPRV
jgi:hypothetical protein